MQAPPQMVLFKSRQKNLKLVIMKKTCPKGPDHYNTMIKRILKKELDTVSVDTNATITLPEHNNIRGASAYN